MASNRGPGAVGGGPTTSEYHKERDTGFNSWKGSTSATAGVPGGSWGSVAREPAYGTPSVHVIPNPGAAAPATTVGGSSDGSYEKNLILELCPPGGVKPVPPPDKLAAFARSVSSLNSELICPALLDFLEEGQPWIIRAKALCVMETAIQNGIVPANGTNPYKTFFHACAAEIQPLATHPRAAIAEPAKRVLLLLGITPGTVHEAPVAAAAAPVAAAPVAAPNLLDFEDDAAAAAPPAQPPSQPPPPPPTAAPPAAPAAAAGNSSMFGGMTVKGAAAPPAAAPPAPVAPPAAPPVAAAPPAPPAGGGLLDFSDPFAPAASGAAAAESNDSSATTPGTTTSMFGELSIKEEKKKEDETPAAAPEAAPAASGSAFGFINTAAAAPASAAEPKSFDPLQSLDGGSSSSSTQVPTATATSPQGMQKMMMSLSTEQMQAMAYQQMMMQQQMQQMQMAAMMAQQQRGGMPPPTMPMQFRQSSGSGSFAGPSKYQPAKKDDKKFDFVKDAMVSAEKKK